MNCGISAGGGDGEGDVRRCGLVLFGTGSRAVLVAATTVLASDSDSEEEEDSEDEDSEDEEDS